MSSNIRYFYCEACITGHIIGGPCPVASFVGENLTAAVVDSGDAIAGGTQDAMQAPGDCSPSPTSQCTLTVKPCSEFCR